LEYHDSKSFFTLDFSLQGEQGKNKVTSYGLIKRAIENGLRFIMCWLTAGSPVQRWFNLLNHTALDVIFYIWEKREKQDLSLMANAYHQRNY
jgi:hypothetical protein